MDNMSPGGALGQLLAAPFIWWQDRDRRRRLISPHELNLRRATRPLGYVAVLAWTVWLFGARSLRDLLASELHDPAANWIPLALIGAALLYGITSFAVGLRGCWGVRSDGFLPMTAAMRFALGVGGLVLLMSNEVTRRTAPDLWTASGWMLLTFVAVWNAAVGAARFVLLAIGDSTALGLVNRHIRQTQIIMRPVRPRPWWKFW